MLIKIFLLIVVNAIGALTYPIGKLTFLYGNPLFLTGVRMVAAGILLTWFSYFFQKKPIVINKRFIGLLILLSLFNVFITNFLQFWALDRVSASKAILIFNMSPFIAATLSYFIYHEKLTMCKFIALVISFLGFLPVLLTDSDSTHLVSFLSIPEFALMCAAVCSVIGWLIMKTMLRTSTISLFLANGLSMIIGGLLFFPSSWLTEGKDWYSMSNIGYLLFLLGILLFANNIINYNAYAYFIKFLSPTLLFLLSFTGPLFTLFFSWLFLGEKIHVSFIATLIIVGAGLVLYYKEESRLMRIAKQQME